MNTQDWESVLRITSERPLDPTGAIAQPDDHIDRRWDVTPLGRPPQMGLPEGTRLRWVKNQILRLIRIYNSQDGVNGWFYERLSEHREMFVRTFDEDKKLYESLDCLRSEYENSSSFHMQKIRNLEQALDTSNTFIQGLRQLAAANIIKGNQLDESSQELRRKYSEMDERMSRLDKRLQELDEGSPEIEADNPDFIRGVETTLRHDGLFGKYHLWFNNPLVFQLDHGTPRLAQVNERIIEPVEAVAMLRRFFPDGGKVLDVGSAESMVPFQYATLGYKTTALDMRPYPLQHPNLVAVSGDFFEVNLAGESYDYVSCISTVEHFGIGWYDDPHMGLDADTHGLRKMLDVMKAGGILFLTTPIAGTFSVNDLERTYTPSIIRERLESVGFQIIAFDVYKRSEARVWEKVDASDLGDTRGVAVITSRKGRLA